MIRNIPLLLFCATAVFANSDILLGINTWGYYWDERGPTRDPNNVDANGNPIDGPYGILLHEYGIHFGLDMGWQYQHGNHEFIFDLKPSYGHIRYNGALQDGTPLKSWNNYYTIESEAAYHYQFANGFQLRTSLDDRLWSRYIGSESWFSMQFDSTGYVENWQSADLCLGIGYKWTDTKIWIDGTLPLIAIQSADFNSSDGRLHVSMVPQENIGVRMGVSELMGTWEFASEFRLTYFSKSPFGSISQDSIFSVVPLYQPDSRDLTFSISIIKHFAINLSN